MLYEKEEFIRNKRWNIKLSVLNLSKDEFNEVYDILEDENAHSDNVIFLANRVGNEEEILLAKEIKQKHIESNSISRADYEARTTLRLALEAKSKDLFFQ